MPQIVVLFGATGDSVAAKLLPGLFHLAATGFIPKCRVIGVSLDDIDADAFRKLAHKAVERHHSHKPIDGDWPIFAAALDYVPLAQGARALKHAVEEAAAAFGEAYQLVHYASVPPSAALSAVRMLDEASRQGFSHHHGKTVRHRSRERGGAQRPIAQGFFRGANLPDRPFPRQGPGAEHSRLPIANGLFEPIWSRNFIDHIQIDVPETLDIGSRVGFYEQTGAYRDMVVTHLFQILAFTAMEPPTSLAPGPISEEKNKVFRSLMPIDPADEVRGQYIGYRKEKRDDPESDTETFIALKCRIDNWRWAGVPFYLRTGKRMAEGQRIISIAFREPPRSMFPEDSGIGSQGPDHLTFDLADLSRVSLSFYGKKPGPGMRLAKQSLQFAMHETGLAGEVLEAYERLILDAMRGDHTLFCSADGIERLWEVSTRLLDNPPSVQIHAPGSWGPQSIYQLVAPHSWRLPFERAWRDPNILGA